MRNPNADKSRPELTVQEARRGVVVIYAVFVGLALVTSALALALSYLLYFQPKSRIQQAATWQEVPCVVTSAKMLKHSIDVRYHYEFDGQEYESTQYNLLSGTSGEDGWARDAAIRLSKNPSTVCFVNPADPSEAVLDRELDYPALSLILPAVFAVIALGFILKLLFGMGRYRAAARRMSGLAHVEPTSKRSVSGPLADDQKRPAALPHFIACMAAFGIIGVVFIAMDGIPFVRSLSYENVRWKDVEGQVDWSRDSGTSTMLGGDVTEYQIGYVVNGTTHSSHCYSTSRPEKFEIEYDIDRPWRGRLKGTTLQATPPVFLLIPAGFGVLVLLGLMQSAYRVVSEKVTSTRSIRDDE